MNSNYKRLCFIALLCIISVIPCLGQGPKESHSLLIEKLKTATSDTTKIAALANLSRHFYFKPSQTKADLDSCYYYAQKVIELARTANSDLGEAVGYQLLGNHARSDKKIEQSGRYIRKAIEIFERKKDYLKLGEAYYDYSLTFDFNDQRQERIRFAEKSRDAFFLSGSILKQADILKELADLYRGVDEPKSFMLGEKSLMLYKSIHHPYLQGIYDLLGATLLAMGDTEGALEYGLLALNAAKQSGDTGLQLATIHNRIGMSFFSVKKNQQAIEHYAEGLKIARSFNDGPTIVYLVINMAVALIRIKKPDQALEMLIQVEAQFPESANQVRVLLLGRYVMCFADLKQFSRGQKYCNELVTLLKEGNDNFARRLGYPALAQFYFASKQFDLAEKYVINVAALPRKAITTTLITNQVRWSKIDSMRGNWQSAIRHYQIAKAMEDSLFTEVKSRRIEFLEMQLATEKRDYEIKQKQQDIDLLQQHNKIMEVNLQQASLLNKVIAVVVVLTLAIMALLVANIRHRYWAYRKLQEKQLLIDRTNVNLNELVKEKEWLVREIHLRVNNNFQSVIGLLGDQKNYMRNERALNALEESQQRIMTMSLVHEKLFASENYDTIRIDEYILNLITYIRESFQTDRVMDFIVNIPKLELHFSYGQPLGMIVSEAVTNAIKYAFPDGKRGIVAITLITKPNQEIQLTIKDNGIGFPEVSVQQNLPTMGMNLVNGLCHEIDADLKTFNDGGAAIQISFIYNLT